MKIKKGEKLEANLHDKTKCVIHIRNLKQSLKHELVFKKVHWEIKFNQNAWLKRYINMNTDLRKKAKADLKNNFLSWWIMQFLKKTMENMRKHSDMKLVTTEWRRNVLMFTPKLFIKKYINNRSEKGTDTYEN